MKINIEYNEYLNLIEFSLLEKYDFVYKENHYVIDEHFTSDGASFPPSIKARLNPFDPRYLKSFHKHDYFYSTGKISRKEADTYLLECLKIDGMRIFSKI